MIAAMRVVRLLALVVWVGGLVFFAFVVAPVAFMVLPSTHVAGTVVAGTLNVLNIMGVICALVLLLACTGLWITDRGMTSRGITGRAHGAARNSRLISGELWLVLGMLVATAYVHWRIVPAMERDRIAAGGDVDAAPADDPARRDFERLHPISEKVEGTVLLLGLATVVLVGLEREA